MSSKNGKIEIDLNKITRREFRRFTEAVKETEGLDSDQLTGELIAKVVTHWPYGDDISADAYLDLPLGKSQEVDQALTEALADLGEKK